MYCNLLVLGTEGEREGFKLCVARHGAREFPEALGEWFKRVDLRIPQMCPEFKRRLPDIGSDIEHRPDPILLEESELTRTLSAATFPETESPGKRSLQPIEHMNLLSICWVQYCCWEETHYGSRFA